ncbi:MAG TPA: OmpA family protein [Sulfuriferula sp.]|nr:OmpA family protein [Sulfuriferula sp.]
MSLTIRTLVALSCAVLAGQALAAELDTRLYLTPSVNFTVTDSDWYNKQGIDNDFGFGLGVGKAISQSWNLELNSNYAEYNIHNSSGSLKNTGLGVDALYFFNRNPEFSPYALVGAGGVQTRAPGISETNWAANAGLGAMKWINDIAIRGDVRYRYIDGVGGINPGDWIATAGLVIPLGAKPVPPAPQPAPAPEPMPAPAAAPEPAPQPEPAIERPAPQTKIILEGTNFDFDKATLRPAGKAKLDENVKTLMAYPDINVEIAGYTDSIGTAKYNMGLSKRRAETVKKYMESKGVAASRMTTKGFGEAKPIASNKTAAGRAENRRVEILILN